MQTKDDLLELALREKVVTIALSQEEEDAITREYFKDIGPWEPPPKLRIVPAEQPKKPISGIACLLWGVSLIWGFCLAYGIYLAVRGY